VHPQVARAGGTHTHRSERGSDVAGHVAAAGRLVVVVDALELEVGVAVVGAGRANAVLVGDNPVMYAPGSRKEGGVRGAS
jgi:hypothetical protein